MDILIDIGKRVFYMSFFIALIPIGAYTIHTGASAVVAMASYLILSALIPSLYIASKDSGFGAKQVRISRLSYWCMWCFVQFITYMIFSHVDLKLLWELPTIGRDVVFMIAMYVQVVMALALASLWKKE